MPPMEGGYGPIPSPGCIVSDSKGNVYVSEPSRYQEYKYSPKGELLAKWGGKNSPQGPYGLTVVAVDHADHLYALRPNGDGIFQIQRLDAEGRLLNLVHSYYSSPAQPGPGDTMGVAGIAFDSHDNLFVLDALNNRICVFGPLGNFLRFFGPSEQGSTGGASGSNGWVAEPISILMDSKDNVLFSDHDYLAKVQMLDSKGKFVQQWGGREETREGKFVGAMAQDRSGRLFTACGDGMIRISDWEGNVENEFGMPPPHDEKHLFTPVALTVTPDGKVWVCDVSGRRVVVFAPVSDEKRKASK